ncbi:hypothetical protein Tco_0177295, partial [Tanacetum coccineum]
FFWSTSGSCRLLLLVVVVVVGIVGWIVVGKKRLGDVVEKFVFVGIVVEVVIVEMQFVDRDQDTGYSWEIVRHLRVGSRRARKLRVGIRRSQNLVLGVVEHTGYP